MKYRVTIVHDIELPEPNTYDYEVYRRELEESWSLQMNEAMSMALVMVADYFKRDGHSSSGHYIAGGPEFRVERI
jgi:hypothetical protein